MDNYNDKLDKYQDLNRERWENVILSYLRDHLGEAPHPDFLETIDRLTSDDFTGERGTLYALITNYVLKNNVFPSPLKLAELAGDDVKIDDISGNVKDVLPQDVIEATQKLIEIRKIEIVKKETEKLLSILPTLRTSDDLLREVNITVSRMESLSDVEKEEGTTLKAQIRDIMTGVDDDPPPLPTGIPELDDLLKQKRDHGNGGLHAGEVTGVVARSGVGKSAFMSQIAYSIAYHVGPVLIFTLEMSAKELTYRVIQQQTDLTEAGIAIEEAPVHLIEDDEERYSIERIRKTIGRYVRKYEIKAVFIDYIDYIEKTKEEKDQPVYAVLEDQTKEIVRMAKKFQIPIVLLVQQNRPSSLGKKTGRGLDSLAGSDGIARKVHVVIIIEQAENDPTARIIHIAKNRNGRTGFLEVDFDQRSVTFKRFRLPLKDQNNNSKKVVITEKEEDPFQLPKTPRQILRDNCRGELLVLLANGQERIKGKTTGPKGSIKFEIKEFDVNIPESEIDAAITALAEKVKGKKDTYRLRSNADEKGEANK